MSDQTDPTQPNAIQGLAQASDQMVPPSTPVVPAPPAEIPVETPTAMNNDVPPAPIMDQFSASGTTQAPVVIPEVAPKKHTNILVLLLLFVGVLLVAAGAAYYFVIMKKAPVPEEQPVAEQPAPVAPAETPTPPVSEAPVAPAEVAQDALIQQMNTGIKSQSMNQIEKDLDALDYEGIDTEVKADQF